MNPTVWIHLIRNEACSRRFNGTQESLTIQHCRFWRRWASRVIEKRYFVKIMQQFWKLGHETHGNIESGLIKWFILQLWHEGLMIWRVPNMTWHDMDINPSFSKPLTCHNTHCIYFHHTRGYCTTLFCAHYPIMSKKHILIHRRSIKYEHYWKHWEPILQQSLKDMIGRFMSLVILFNTSCATIQTNMFYEE